MLNEANKQTHNNTVARQSEHVCCVSDGPVKIIFVVVDAVQAIAMIEPRPPLPISILQNVCVDVIISTLLIYALRAFWERLSCRLVVFLESEIHLLTVLALKPLIGQTCAPF